MITIILALLIALVAQAPSSQPETKNSQAVETHINDIIKKLPADSELRRALLQGARGKGVHYSWMDGMRGQGVKRVDVWIDISFDHKGRPKKMSVNRTEYFTQYEGRTPISDNTRVDAIRASGLEGELNAIALEKAKHGFGSTCRAPDHTPLSGARTLNS